MLLFAPHVEFFGSGGEFLRGAGARSWKMRDHIGIQAPERSGTGMSGNAWLEFIQDLDPQGFPTPLTVTTDGARERIQSIDQIFTNGHRYRVHRIRNFATKTPFDQRNPINSYKISCRRLMGCLAERQGGAGE